mmetsp:Transcript_62547/g.53058  ORF Transcript_62547/g.53058 Transcript_62547/m.53058 type:complete len:91 (-) Transcript_62547:166-438(-)
MAAQCGHLICASCVYSYMDAKNKNAVNCPVCNKNIVKRDLKFVLFQASVDEELDSIELVLLSKLKNSNFICYNNMENELSLFDSQINFQR